MKNAMFACAMGSLLAFASSAGAVTASPGGSVTLVGQLKFEGIQQEISSETCAVELNGTMNASTGSITITSVQLTGALCEENYFYTQFGNQTTSLIASSSNVGGYTSSLLMYMIFPPSGGYPYSSALTCQGSLNLSWDAYGTQATIQSNIPGVGGECVVSGTLYLAPFQSFKQ